MRANTPSEVNSLEQSSPRQRIKYVSLNGPGGYAVAAKRYMLALNEMNTAITWTPMVDDPQGRLGYKLGQGMQYYEPELSEFCNLDIDYDTVIVHLVPEYYPMLIAREPGKRIVGCTVWETNQIPDHWKHLLNSVDALTVPCHWNKQVFIENGVTVPIYVVPHVALPAQEKRADCSWPGIAPDDYVFYSIGVWSTRKALWLTVQAYLDAFTASDPVCLVLKTTRLDYTNFLPYWLKRLGFKDRALARTQIEQIQSLYPNPAKIICVDEDLSEGQIHQLHERGDCYVSLSRAEGWAIGAFDACAFGNPVISCGYGGHRDYLRPDLAYLIDYQEIPVQDRNPWLSYKSGGVWAEPDVAQASTVMRDIIANRTLAEARGAALKQHVCLTFSAERVAEQFFPAISGEQ